MIDSRPIKLFLFSIFKLGTFLCMFLFLGSSVNQVDQNNFDVHFYFADVELKKDTTFIQGSNRIDAIATNDLEYIDFDVSKYLDIDSVLLNDSIADYSRSGDKIIIQPKNIVKAGSNFSAIIFYQGDGNDPRYRGGLFNRTSPVETPVTYSLSEPFSTKTWLPCKENLNDKADSVYVYITVPDSMMAGSVGLLKDIVEVEDSKRKYKWESKYPIAFYLISVAVGYYQDYSFNMKLDGWHDSLPVVNFIYADSSYFADKKHQIDETTSLLNIYSDLFGIYPFIEEKYGHSAAPMGGGMEHQTMTTLVNFGYELVAHELAHQWFGNYVTCSSWQDIWINEGFASYAEYLAYDYRGRESAKKTWLDATQKDALKERSGSIYVPDEEADDASRLFYNNLTYDKGACIIHMIRHELDNDDLFFTILRAFLEKFSYGNASGEDFKVLLEDISGISFDNFFREWYYGEGYPEMEIYWKHQEDTLTIINHQKPTAPSATPLFHVKVDYRIELGNRDTILTFRQEQLNDTFKVVLTERIRGFETDPENFLLRKILRQERLAFDGISERYRIFPNPAKNELIIEPINHSESFSVSVFYSDGKLINEYSDLKGLLQINTEKYPPGIYVIRIKTDAGLQGSRTIIKE